MNTFIDTHAHLYVDQFEADRFEMVDRALVAGVDKIYLPNIDEGTIDEMMKLCLRYPDHLFPMMGLHPCSVKEDFNEVLDRMEEHLTKQQFYGIGETGIDLYWDSSTEALQVQSFSRQIEWAKSYDLPIIIHSRSALDTTIELIENHMDERLRGIFHCFDGTVEQARRIKETGFFMGIGGVITYKRSHLPEVISTIGLEGIVLETDAPYLSPTPKRGKRNESAYLLFIAQWLADLLKVPLATVSQITTRNAKEILEGRK